MATSLESSSDAQALASAAPEREYYSISEAAALLGVSRVSIWRWIRANRIQATRLGYRTVRIERGQLQQALARVRGTGLGWRVDQALGRGAHFADTFNSEGPPTPGSRELSDVGHFVQFYEADAFLVDAVMDFIGPALQSGDAALVIATEAHRAALEARLRSSGLDLDSARVSGQFISLDAAATLSKLMVDGSPDRERFEQVIGDLLKRATRGERRARVFGEMVALLVADGNYSAALVLEGLWDDRQRSHSFARFCAYPMDSLGGVGLADVFSEICAQHSRAIPAESYAAVEDPCERLRAITLLQQRARSLEGEIAERKRAEERERAAREAAEAALRLRNEFLSIAAHELRTPLTSLSGYAQLVLRLLDREGQADPERLVRALHTITNQANKLDRLLGQLLDISRLEAGKLTLDRRWIDLSVLVEQAVTEARARTDEHTLSLEAPESLEAWVDPLRLEQVLTNLLDNAIKYSPEGGRIEVSLSSESGAAVELAVRDHGPGIPPEKRGQIFECFFQAQGSNGGMGLGLYVSRQIAELHGGQIRAEFPADGGARFVVRLPVKPDEQAAS